MSPNFTTNAKKVAFSDAKAGDRVWSLIEGWGTITKRFSQRTQYPLYVEFDKGTQRTYTLWGLVFITDNNPTLFWDEVKFEIPEKPMPALEVDAKVLVWGCSCESKIKRHFSHFENDALHAFNHGYTSWTGGPTTAWPKWELAE